MSTTAATEQQDICFAILHRQVHTSAERLTGGDSSVAGNKAPWYAANVPRGASQLHLVCTVKLFHLQLTQNRESQGRVLARACRDRGQGKVDAKASTCCPEHNQTMHDTTTRPTIHMSLSPLLPLLLQCVASTCMLQGEVQRKQLPAWQKW